FPGFRIFPASESLLEKALPLGAAGCISATANVQPRTIVNAIEQWGSDGFAGLQAEANAVRSLFQRHPMIPALKYVVGEAMGDPGWRNVRPPLRSATEDWAGTLASDLADLNFSMVAP
ncbi:dihydrodipicolinate synthase family protein, partial [Variovorax sp. GB1P17]|uniref:dihydrodipicolinate synthase family protein n=1 Tax=Variovorax sp. GB1P17 TaxID=3443740 RepID=UPI003F477C61